MKKTLFQHSTIAVLMDGLFDGTLSISELLEHGSLGIGTLHGLNGELFINDNQAYKIDVNGQVHKLKGSEKTPYAAVTVFKPDDFFTQIERITEVALKEKIEKQFVTVNTFQAVKITGTFKNISCRSVEKQTKPYPRLPEVAKDQAEFTAEKITGTIVGFYTPEIFETLAVPEFHLHFLSDDHDFGGHVLNFTFEEGTVEWQMLENINQHFPVKSKAFRKAEIDYENLTEDIETSE